jgi:hypothetical protein
LLGYYADDGKLIYAGRVGTGMAVKVPRGSPAPPRSAGPQDVAAERPAAPQHALRIAARALPRPLGRAEARRGDHLFDLDGRRRLRHTVYVGLREDKPADQVRRER